MGNYYQKVDQEEPKVLHAWMEPISAKIENKDYEVLKKWKISKNNNDWTINNYIIKYLFKLNKTRYAYVDGSKLIQLNKTNNPIMNDLFALLSSEPYTTSTVILTSSENVPTREIIS